MAGLVRLRAGVRRRLRLTSIRAVIAPALPDERRRTVRAADSVVDSDCALVSNT